MLLRIGASWAEVGLLLRILRKSGHLNTSSHTPVRFFRWSTQGGVTVGSPNVMAVGENGRDAVNNVTGDDLFRGRESQRSWEKRVV